MKPYIEVIKDSFVDYAGKTHHFIIAAVSKSSNPLAIINPEDLLAAQDTQEFTKVLTHPLDLTSKGVSIGIAICNPEDEFDEKVGICKAVGRANGANPALYATNNGYINTTLVRAFLQQEAEYLKNNPEQYIAGYEDSKSRYLKRKSMEEMKENFSSTEKIIVEEVQKNPRFLDNVNTYLAWLDNQNKGKCKENS